MAERPRNEGCGHCWTYGWAPHQAARIGLDIDGSHHPACPTLREMPTEHDVLSALMRGPAGPADLQRQWPKSQFAVVTTLLSDMARRGLVRPVGTSYTLTTTGARVQRAGGVVAATEGEPPWRRRA